MATLIRASATLFRKLQAFLSPCSGRPPCGLGARRAALLGCPSGWARARCNIGENRQVIGDSELGLLDQYIGLLERSLTGTIAPEARNLKGRLYDPALREEGRDWPAEALTMVGLRRLHDLRTCVQTILADGVPGDLLEAGVWRGGVGIYLRALLAAHEDRLRRVWIADSFRGLPPPELGGAEEDVGDIHWTHRELSVGLGEVLENFDRYGLLDGRVRVIEGWFEQTLAWAPVERLALLRADGDMYSSTWTILEQLEPKVAPGGFIVIDDYGAVPGCGTAVDRYRELHEIDAPLVEIDWTGVRWRKSR